MQRHQRIVILVKNQERGRGFVSNICYVQFVNLFWTKGVHIGKK